MPIRGTWLHPEAKSPLTTSLIVPSPPTMTTVSAPSAAAAAASSAACWGALLIARRKGNPCLRRSSVIFRNLNPHRPQLALSLTITMLEDEDPRYDLLLLNSGWPVYDSSVLPAMDNQTIPAVAPGSIWRHVTHRAAQATMRLPCGDRPYSGHRAACSVFCRTILNVLAEGLAYNVVRREEILRPKLQDAMDSLWNARDPDPAQEARQATPPTEDRGACPSLRSPTLGAASKRRRKDGRMSCVPSDSRGPHTSP